MSERFLYKECDRCGGDGQLPNNEVGFNGEVVEPDPEDIYSCPKCDGTGQVLIGSFELKLSGIYNAYEVLEAIDVTEYNALTDVQKDGVKMLLCCGEVDLNDGKAGKVRLWNWFGAESDTVANLTALMES